MSAGRFAHVARALRVQFGGLISLDVRPLGVNRKKGNELPQYTTLEVHDLSLPTLALSAMVERDSEDDLVDEVTEDLFNALADLHAIRERHRLQEDEIGDLDEFLMEAVEDPEVLKSQNWWKNDGPQLYMALKYINRAKEKIEADLETRPGDWDNLL